MLSTRSWAIGLILMAAAGRGSPEGHSPDGTEIGTFTVRSDRLATTLSAENQWLVLEQSGTGERSSPRNGVYEQGLEWDLSGSVYHPNFMSYVLNTGLGLSELQDSASPDQSLDYALTADVHFLTNWLQEKPYPFSIYADRRDGLQDYDPFQRVRVAETTVGGFGQWANGIAPLYLSLGQSWKDEQRENWSSSEDAFTVRVGADWTSADQSSVTRGDYSFSDFDRSVIHLFAYQGRSHEARLSNRLSFGDSPETSLSSNIRFLNLAGTTEDRVLDLSEQVEMRHQWGLTSSAAYNLRASADTAGDTMAQDGRVGLRHVLYESLTSSLGLSGSVTTTTGYRQRILGPDMETRYRKNISVGFLNLDYGLNPSLEERDTSDPTARVVDEPHALQDGTITFLDNPNVDLSLIVVTDETGTTFYLVNVDYTVTEIAGRTQLRRMATGRIPDGGTALVDYVYASDPSFVNLTMVQTAGVRFDLFEDRLSVYYRYMRRSFPYSKGAPTLNRELLNDHLAGLVFDLPPLSCTAEYQHYGSSAFPYDAVRSQQGVLVPIATRSLLSIQGAESFTFFTGLEQTQTLLEFISRYSVSVGEHVELAAGGGYRLQGETDSPVSTLWTAQADASYLRGPLALSAEYRFQTPGGEGTERQNHSVLVSLTREF